MVVTRERLAPSRSTTDGGKINSSPLVGTLKMARLPRPFYVKPVDKPDDVLIFGKSPEQVLEDHAQGVSRFGGLWRTPNYALSYMTAASILIDTAVQQERLDDIGLPAFYLQRHCAELMLKSLLTSIYAISDYRVANQDEDSADIPTNQRNRTETSHNLPALLQDLINLTTGMRLPPVPGLLIELISKLSAIETSATWSRYSQSVNRAGTIDHVASEAVVPLVQLQEHLEATAARTTSLRPGEETYAMAIYEIWLSYARTAGDAA